jgi:predicted transcriptional regulator
MNTVGIKSGLPVPRPPKQLVDMADSRNIKPDARRIVDELPDTATWEDLMYEIYVRESIEAGLADADAGRVVSHEDAISRIRARIRRAS